MEKINYAKNLDKIIHSSKEIRPRVMLHSCCGPCSSSVLEFLTKYFDVVLLWYNPNLFPEEEFWKRFETQKEIIQKMGLQEQVRIKFLPWDSEYYFAAISGMEDELEGGRRCEECFRLRLRQCAQTAKEEGMDYFCTTLTVSRYKNAPLINTIGEEIGQQEGIPWLPSDFKKNGGEMRSNQLSREYGIYRQDYCGCKFSLENRRIHEDCIDNNRYIGIEKKGEIK